jgi:hypothetical protein
MAARGRAVAIGSAIGVIVGVAAGASVIYIESTENFGMRAYGPDGTTLDWRYLLVVGASWALPAFLVAGVVATVVMLARVHDAAHHS